ncbi:Protein kinase [uncultured virus]|nr:Protein kinase [uncultured virus]
MSAALQRVSKAGEGTYGVVYKAKQIFPELPVPPGSLPSTLKVEEKFVAVKQNLKDFSASWFGNPRELTVLAMFKGCPFVVDLLNVSFGDPFSKISPMSPVKEADKKMREDKIHFVMEFVPITSDRFFADKSQCTPVLGKVLACQLLLAIEFIHSRNITHRDLKPANLLISNEPGEGIRIKVCDFGMSQVMCRGAPATPGVATSWYRAPCVCCSSAIYGTQSDIWSVGCIIFEIFGKHPFLYAAGDNDVDAFNTILGRLPKKPDEQDIKKIQRYGKVLPITPAASPIRRESFLERMQMTPAYMEEFKRTQGSIEQLIDLLGGLLQIDPDKRLTATQALEHPFFEGFRDYIKGVREMYPPRPPPLPLVRIIGCVERKWAVRIAFAIYNERARFNWYSHRLIFHAIDLFDRYLEFAFAAKAGSLGVMETDHVGRLHTKAKAELYFWVCLYLLHKYYATMTYPVEWRVFAPKIYTDSEQEIIAEQYEILLIKDVVQYCLYRDTLLEIADQFPAPVTEQLVRDMLLAYGQCNEWNDGSARALFRKLMLPPPATVVPVVAAPALVAPTAPVLAPAQGIVASARVPTDTAAVVPTNGGVAPGVAGTGALRPALKG